MITLLGAGHVPPGALAESLARAPRLVAADGGAAAALAAGVMPEAVIGDFDSLDPATRASIPPERMHLAEDQNLTDFEKALACIAAPLVLAVGFTGRRLDHELAVYNALIKAPMRPVLVIGEEDICLALTDPLTLLLPVGTRVSLFPMAEVSCASTGLRWATDHLTFAPWGRVGTSNEAISERVWLSPNGPGMLVILPRTQLDVAIGALRGTG